MKFKNIVVLGVVEAVATLVLNEGIKLAKKNGLFEKAKDCWNELTNWPAASASVPAN